MGIAACAGNLARAQSVGDRIPKANSETAPSGPQPTQAAGKAEVLSGPISLASIPDAPLPSEEVMERASESRSSDFVDFRTATIDSSIVSTRAPGYVSLDQCPDDMTHAKSCRVHWHQLVISSTAFNAFQNAGNIYTGYWYRWETTHGKWFDRWINSAAGWKWDRWSDQNPILDDYVGHPMMGGITNYLWIQNDPKGMTLEFNNTRSYWHSRMRALAFSTAYSFQWKLGPLGEAGIGHNGDHIVPQDHVPVKDWTNETGWVELVTTPVGGLLWTMAEDAFDKHIVKRIEERPRGPLPLLLVSFLTPARATANIFRFRPPWYRDGRNVRSNSFWSEPGAEDEAGDTSDSAPTSAETAVSTTKSETKPLPEWPHYGGVHEFGAWWGLSPISGHIWGYAKDVKYMPVDATYSYLLIHGSLWNFRYAPEVTALAMLDEINPAATNRFTQRKRTYGSGVSPVGFRASFFPQGRVQPFLSTDGGFIYFGDRVLSPQGSQFMYTIDFGGGIQIFRKTRQTISIGYRYQHLSNANISLHNPGADANTFYLAVSRFRTKHYR
jgi:hypothetical protein